MKNLNNYINEAWSGVKQQSLKSDIEAWCEEMEIQNYIINDKGEIDVDKSVTLDGKSIVELPYKFGKVKGYFSLRGCKNLTSLKNCPNEVGLFFRCSHCPKLESLEGCPKEVNGSFFCRDCRRNFTEEEVRTLCKVKGKINI